MKLTVIYLKLPLLFSSGALYLYLNENKLIVCVLVKNVFNLYMSFKKYYYETVLSLFNPDNSTHFFITEQTPNFKEINEKFVY